MQEMSVRADKSRRTGSNLVRERSEKLLEGEIARLNTSI